ncbi:hypothetical protein BDP81DRAFT_28763 [Colletotrichum phormii]|uniref:Uncharacterized protein n=1 Tax=Colletotrichum phormii TaxID=359342 RepID=A0AAI9ZRD2_9PEZI|nr:uncharacterized protein BDP81DRAFT_28763 [Colletotrichum phormii]KAK1636800.1 hypothetical protein BDP81DRAFT_28763 [Colletotrichum phormii]
MKRQAGSTLRRGRNRSPLRVRGVFVPGALCYRCCLSLENSIIVPFFQDEPSGRELDNLATDEKAFNGVFAALLVRTDLIDDDALVSSSVSRCRPVTENSEIPALQRPVVGLSHNAPVFPVVLLAGGSPGLFARTFWLPECSWPALPACLASNQPAKDKGPGRRHCRWSTWQCADIARAPYQVCSAQRALRSEHGGAPAWNRGWEMAVVQIVREVGIITPENPLSHLPYPFFSEVTQSRGWP